MLVKMEKGGLLVVKDGLLLEEAILFEGGRQVIRQVKDLRLHKRDKKEKRKEEKK